MNVRQLFLGAFAIQLATTTAFCQAAPLNDNFTNRTILSGSSITFTGSLANATLENGEPYPISSGDSIWWSWTTPSSTPVIITLARDLSAFSSQGTWFEVFTNQTFQSLSRIDYNSFDAPAGRYVKFSATAGTTYQFRAAGGWPGVLTMELIASRAPIILSQPSDVTASPYGAAMFRVMAAGIPSPAYQWLFNGTPLPGETAPILIKYNTLTNVAGSYSVIVSNTGGMIQSEPALLSIVDTNPVPRLSALRVTNTTQCPFTLRGEAGRWYKFEIIIDAEGWISANWFGLCTNETTVFSVPNFHTSPEFVRASLNGPTDGCVAQLNGLRAARDLYAIDYRLSANSPLTLFNLMPYWKGNQIPFCPQSGTYTIGAGITNDATCSLRQISGHTIGN